MDWIRFWWNCVKRPWERSVGHGVYHIITQIFIASQSFLSHLCHFYLISDRPLVTPVGKLDESSLSWVVKRGRLRKSSSCASRRTVLPNQRVDTAKELILRTLRFLGSELFGGLVLPRIDHEDFHLGSLGQTMEGAISEERKIGGMRQSMSFLSTTSTTVTRSNKNLRKEKSASNYIHGQYTYLKRDLF